MGIPNLRACHFRAREDINVNRIKYLKQLLHKQATRAKHLSQNVRFFFKIMLPQNTVLFQSSKELCSKLALGEVGVS